MNELNLSISTGKDDQNRVVLTALFASHDEAVRFHNGLAKLCDGASRTPAVSNSIASWRGRLIPYRSDS
jgi:hypothetical protein